MILVDTSVLIDYFNGRANPKTDFLDSALAREPILIGDLILTEVLQGFREGADYLRARQLLAALEFRELGGYQVAVAAADNYRALRLRGVTVRKTIDMIIAPYCIMHGIELLHSDRDFDIMETELGLLTPRLETNA
jgi:hypothetical protein